MGFASELDAYSSAMHPNLDRGRTRLPRSNWLKACGRDEPRASTLESPAEEPPAAEDPPLLLLKEAVLVETLAGITREINLGCVSEGRLDRSFVIMLPEAFWGAGLITVLGKVALPFRPETGDEPDSYSRSPSDPGLSAAQAIHRHAAESVARFPRPEDGESQPLTHPTPRATVPPSPRTSPAVQIRRNCKALAKFGNRRILRSWGLRTSRGRCSD